MAQKQTDEVEIVQPKAKKYKSVVTFVNSALSSYPQLTKPKASGFVEYMRSQDKFYLADEREFIEHLNKYLGIK